MVCNVLTNNFNHDLGSKHKVLGVHNWMDILRIIIRRVSILNVGKDTSNVILTINHISYFIDEDVEKNNKDLRFYLDKMENGRYSGLIIVPVLWCSIALYLKSLSTV